MLLQGTFKKLCLTRRNCTAMIAIQRPGSMQYLAGRMTFSGSETLILHTKIDDPLDINDAQLSRCTSAPHKIDFDPVDIPVHEVLNMFRSCELMNSKEKCPAASINVSSSDCDYDPIRALIHFDPPKRFYRVFWRSITRKILERYCNGLC